MFVLYIASLLGFWVCLRLWLVILFWDFVCLWLVV